MTAIGYLVRKSVRNWLLDLRTKPQFILLTAFIVLMVVLGAVNGRHVGTLNQPLVSSAFFLAGLIFG